MGRGKKIGVVLILVGICIIMLTLVFGEGYYYRQDFISNLQDMRFYLWADGTYLPCKYFFGLGIVLTAIGIGFVVLSENVRKKAPTD